MTLKIGKYTGHSKEHFAKANAIFAKVKDSTTTSIPNLAENLISIASRATISLFFPSVASYDVGFTREEIEHTVHLGFGVVYGSIHYAEGCGCKLLELLGANTSTHD